MSKDVESWGVEDVVEWLGKVDLAHKEGIVREKKIDGPALLDEDKLKAAGFTGLQIRKMKKALTTASDSQPSNAARSSESPSTASADTGAIADLKKEIDELKAQVRALSIQPRNQPPKGTVVVPANPVPMSHVNPSPHSKVNVPDFCSGCVIEGNQTQILTITMGVGDAIKSEPGSMVHMSSFIHMNTKAGGGQGFGRLLTGHSFFLVEFTYNGPPGTGDTICVTPDFPGQIIPVNLSQYGGHIICQKGSLLCCAPTVKERVEFTERLGAGFFGGEGFLLLGLVGWGYAFLNARGAIMQMKLAPNERRIVATGCLVAFEKSVKYRVRTMNGLGNVFFGGEGLFVTEMVGPGTIWLESHDMSRLFRVMNSK